MANPEKVKKFLEVSGTKENIVLLKKQFLTVLEKLSLEDEDDLKEDYPEIYSEIVTERNKSMEGIQKKTMEKGLNLAVEFFSDNFSDEEVDKFIDFYSSPIWARLLKLMPEYNQKTISACLPILQEEKEKLEVKFSELNNKLRDKCLNNFQKRGNNFSS